APHAAGLHLEARLDVVDRLLEHLQRIVAGPILDDVEAPVQNALRRAPLPVRHHAVDELGDERALVDRIGRDRALRNLASSWHTVTPSSAASRRTSSGPASAPAPPRRPASRGPRDSERRADP